MFCNFNVWSFLFYKEDLEYKIVELSRALLQNCEILTRFAVLRLCYMYHYAVCCFGSGCRCNLYGFPGEAQSFLFCLLFKQISKLILLKEFIDMFRGDLQFCCVMFSFFFLFIFRDSNKQDCDRRCIEKDSFHFIIFTSVLKASPLVSDELWDNLSSCFQLLRRSHQTFDMGLISIKV